MAAATPMPLAQADSGEEWGGAGGGGSVLTRRVTPKPTGERPARGAKPLGVGPGAIHSSNSVYCVYVRVPRAAPLPFRGPSTGVSPSRRRVT